MKTNIDIGEQLYPESGRLIVPENMWEDAHHAVVLDAELDPLNCIFTYSDSVEINTENLTYITLSRDDLYLLIDLIEESENIYANAPYGPDDIKNI